MSSCFIPFESYFHRSAFSSDWFSFNRYAVFSDSWLVSYCCDLS